MPYKNKADRNYRHEYDTYQGKPEQIKKRDARNAARRAEVKAGKARKGDGKDVDHIKALDKGGTNSKGNLRVVSKSANRSFARDSNHNLISQTSKRERKKK